MKVRHKTVKSVKHIFNDEITTVHKILLLDIPWSIGYSVTKYKLEFVVI